jgi:transposase
MIDSSSVERPPTYPSDLTDTQWELIEPMLPLPKWLGRPELHSRRSIVDAILYVVRTGCSWRQLPVDFPPWQTVYWYFVRWNERGVTERILDELREQVRLAHGREAEPTAGIIDSQSVKGADTVGRLTELPVRWTRRPRGAGWSCAIMRSGLGGAYGPGLWPRSTV